MKLAVSWSGGKDSCLACHKAGASGHEVAVLLNLISKDINKCCFHGIDAELLRAQAASMGIPLLQKEASRDMHDYETEFKSALALLRDNYGVEGAVFGDIYLDEHKEWVERVCAESGLKALEPLWNMPVETVINEFIGAGFKAAIVSAKADLFGQETLKRDIDMSFVNELKSRNIDLCGENGEFHTFVYDGPNFKNAIALGETCNCLVDGFWKHWSLEINSFSIKDKTLR